MRCRENPASFHLYRHCVTVVLADQQAGRRRPRGDNPLARRDGSDEEPGCGKGCATDNSLEPVWTLSLESRALLQSVVSNPQVWPGQELRVTLARCAVVDLCGCYHVANPCVLQ